MGIQSPWRSPLPRPTLNIPCGRASCEPSRNAQLINGYPGILKWTVTTNSIYRCPAEANSGSAIQSIPLYFAKIGSSHRLLAFSILFQYTASQRNGLRFILILHFRLIDRLCGLVVRVSGYRYRGLGFDSRRYHIFWVVVGMERGPLSLVRSNEELLE